MDALLKQLLSSIQARQLFQRDERILVAVSGGVDSMVLLHALDSLAVEMGWDLTVAHLNHRLRGRSSNGDAKFVEALARRLGIRFCGSATDVRAVARQGSISLEMAGRQARHAFFKRAAHDNACTSIALAHHADDQAELFFLRLLRGSGEGLGGMRWIGPLPNDASLKLVRPLLNLPKATLIDYATTMGISFRKDASNDDLDFLRNRIRHELLPLLRGNYQPGFDSVITRTMDILSAEADCVGDIARQWLTTKRRRDFNSLPLAVQRRVLQIQLIASGIVPDFGQIESLRSGPHRPVNLTKDQLSSLRGGDDASGSRSSLEVNEMSVARDVRGSLYFPKPPTGAQRVPTFELSVELVPRGELNLDDTALKWQVASHRGTGAVLRPRRRPLTEYFDADMVGQRIILRHWRPGDRFRPIGMEKAVKLQDLFTNAKIPHNRRHTLTLATTECGDIFWVEGLRISEQFKLTPQTRRRLVWQWKRS